MAQNNTAAASRLIIGIDIGGTFTDAVVVDSADRSVLLAFKLPSTPQDPSVAVLNALSRISSELDVHGATVCHGTTVGTNTLIERGGALTALLATRGFADVIELRRQDRPTLYELTVAISEPLVEPSQRIEVNERIGASGEVVEPLTGIDAVVERVRASGASAVAVCLLHSYANPAHEHKIQKALQQALPGLFITVSSEICPEYGEYERTSTAVVNAYIGPAVKDYLHELDTRLGRHGIDRLLIVKSNGGLTSAANAMRFPAHLIESGPAAGMIATAAYARHVGCPNTIAFDMGGTTAKVGVVTGDAPRTIAEFRADTLRHGRNVGGYPIRGAVLDIVEIGSGGGSIAWIDAAGVPKVGPESAGADPGPACYSRGGTQPTVTDAHAVIGTLDTETFRGSGVQFSRDRAVEAIFKHFAAPMGWTVEKAAHAIISIAVANMTEMVKLATVRRGLDPRDFSLVASGGAGPLHAPLIARDIGVRETLVPPYPGMFSALGATLGRVRHDVSQSLLVRISDLTLSKLEEAFSELERRAADILSGESQEGMSAVIQRSACCRYTGQLWELVVPFGLAGEPLPEVVELERRFRDAYVAEFGIDLPAASVELVKVQITVTLDPLSCGDSFASSSDAVNDVVPSRSQRYIPADGSCREIPVYRSRSAIGLDRQGPLIVEHEGATVWVGEHDRARIRSDLCVVVTSVC